MISTHVHQQFSRALSALHAFSLGDLKPVAQMLPLNTPSHETTQQLLKVVCDLQDTVRVLRQKGYEDLPTSLQELMKIEIPRSSKRNFSYGDMGRYGNFTSWGGRQIVKMLGHHPTKPLLSAESSIVVVHQKEFLRSKTARYIASRGADIPAYVLINALQDPLDEKLLSAARNSGGGVLYSNSAISKDFVARQLAGLDRTVTIVGGYADLCCCTCICSLFKIAVREQVRTLTFKIRSNLIYTREYGRVLRDEIEDAFEKNQREQVADFFFHLVTVGAYPRSIPSTFRKHPKSSLVSAVRNGVRVNFDIR